MQTMGQNVLDWHRGLVASGKLDANPRQDELARQLSDLAAELEQPQKSGIFKSHKKKFAKQGIYVHGKVGRGKTLLLDGFFLSLTKVKKKRVHFHSFMRHFHEQMQGYTESKDKDMKQDGLEIIAADLAKECRVLCFDEFHISDIADATIMARLLKELMKHGVKFVMTSNYHPQDLYPNGLGRHLFVPAIKLIMDKLLVFALDTEQDYRQLSLGDGESYFHSDEEQDLRKMHSIFDKIACDIELEPQVVLQGRSIKAIRRTSDAIWFSFAELCGGPRSQLDYLRLAERFHTIFLSGLPQLTRREQSEAARRFSLLVDVLYDRKIRLLVSGEVPLLEIYGKDRSKPPSYPGMSEHVRTLSRLIEMNSADYQLQEAINS